MMEQAGGNSCNQPCNDIYTRQVNCLICRERLILFDDAVSTSAHKQAIAAVIAREFSHQWFGNMVTPKWWNDLWLSEGFARYFQSFTTAKVEPEWRMDDQFVVSVLHDALNADSSKDSPPMSKDVMSPTEISAKFDTVTYSKGASIIRMMEHVIGNDAFNSSLYKYLRKMNGSSAVGKDLFDVIGAEYNNINPNGSDMGELMESWTTTAGYPLINVECDYNTSEATLTQARFSQNEEDKDSEVPPTSWHILYTYKSKTLPDSKTSIVPNDTVDSTKVGFALADTWILLNLNETGFYRVNYDPHTWHRLSQQLNTDLNEIYLLNRAQLLNDAFALARANKLDYS